MSVGLTQHGEIIRIARDNVLLKISGEVHSAVGVRGCVADQSHACRGEVTEVDRVATVGTAHGDRDMFGTLWRSLQIPQPEHAKPPNEITFAVTTRRTIMFANGQIHLTSGCEKLAGDLDPRCTSADDEHRTGRKLLRVLV